jgi:hypothetical protein
MRYLGLDVHLKAIVYCLVDATGEVTERGKVETTSGLSYKLLSEAVAGEVEEDQVANFLGPYAALAAVRGCRPDWPVLLPVRQHVPGRFGALEHAWKDGDPWLSASDPQRSTTQDHHGMPRHETRGHVWAEVRPVNLTAIMEGKATLTGFLGFT